MEKGALAENFYHYFEIVPAASPPLLEQAYRIRGDVYCKEFGYEREEDCPGGLESDDFDCWAEHCLVRHLGTGRAAGCVRVVEPPPGKPDAVLPLQLHCSQSLRPGPLHPGRLPQQSVCEVSRLAVHRDFRRRTGESQSPFGDLEAFTQVESERRTYPLISVALFLSATALVVRGGRIHVYAMMESKLARLLRRSGLAFEQVGDSMSYHGQRAAFHIHIATALAGLNAPLRELYDSLANTLGSKFQS
jgi:N-acyl amino acid synthase of PEP-CTERM/exosortase system